MARKAVIYKIQFDITDITRNFYLNTSLIIAKHPSEKIERMMLRLIAWSMFANEQLQFTKGLCEKSEPELWIKSDDDIKLWIELGLPHEKHLRKACNRADRVVLFTYGDKAAMQWKNQMLSKFDSLHNLNIINIMDEVLFCAAKAVERTMNIQATIEDGLVTFSINDTAIAIEPQTWKIEGF